MFFFLPIIARTYTFYLRSTFSTHIVAKAECRFLMSEPEATGARKSSRGQHEWGTLREISIKREQIRFRLTPDSGIINHYSTSSRRSRQADLSVCMKDSLYDYSSYSAVSRWDYSLEKGWDLGTSWFEECDFNGVYMGSEHSEQKGKDMKTITEE